MHPNTEGKIIETEELEIHSGMFPGDSSSPLLFCISLIPRTEQLSS
jgi:hypothetical protein